MSEATICPNLLCIWQAVEPEQFEQSFIMPIQEHLESCEAFEIPLVMSGAVLDIVMEKCPWNWYQDEEWKGWINDWFASVWPALDSSRVAHDPEMIEGVGGQCPLAEDEDLWGRWCAFLQWWGNGPTYEERWLKGIAVRDCAENCHSVAVCRRFILIPPASWRVIRYPWLMRYDEDLPVSGQFPFVPPENWQNAMLHGNQHGFLDQEGNEWCWDSLHHNHWDVQLPAGGYHNVNSDGVIL